AALFADRADREFSGDKGGPCPSADYGATLATDFDGAGSASRTGEAGAREPAVQHIPASTLSAAGDRDRRREVVGGGAAGAALYRSTGERIGGADRACLGGAADADRPRTDDAFRIVADGHLPVRLGLARCGGDNNGLSLHSGGAARP